MGRISGSESILDRRTGFAGRGIAAKPLWRVGQILDFGFRIQHLKFRSQCGLFR
jgi:hypothetical protein